VAERFDVVVRSRRAVTPEGERPASVAVRGGVITAVGAYDSELDAAQTIDCGEDALLPGVVDSHVHVNEPGRTEWEGFISATRAAAAGGITTLIDMPLNCVPPTTTVAALQAKRQSAEGRCHVDVGFWGGLVADNLGELAPLHGEGVFGFKCYLTDSGVVEFGYVTREELEPAVAELARLDALTIVHAEDQRLLERAPSAHGGDYGDFLASRPPEVETAAIAEIIGLSRHYQARVHVLHLSAAEALPAIAAARAQGVRLTVETCPHYLALSAEEVPAGATQFKCTPPIREDANREALWRALGDGVVDCVVSDHSPCPPELKHLEVGDFGRAWGGIASLQLSLPVVWTHARRRGYGLVEVVRWMAGGPARLVGLAGKGALAVGFDADLVRFAAEETFTVDPSALHHRHRLTPYAGRELSGVVRSVWLRGREIDLDGPAQGRLLRRDDGSGVQAVRPSGVAQRGNSPPGSAPTLAAAAGDPTESSLFGSSQGPDPSTR